MRRRLLIALTAVGSVIVALGAVGVFTALVDKATSGTNTVNSATQPRATDILIALRTQDASGTWTCGEFTDDLTSGLFTLQAEDFNPSPYVEYCVENRGTHDVDLRITAVEITDTDTACTGDEAEFDVTCGPGPEGQEQPGELSGGLLLSYAAVGCDSTWFVTIGLPHTLLEYANGPRKLMPVNAGTRGCFAVNLSLDPNTELQASQSDTVTWRFRWEATAIQSP